MAFAVRPTVTGEGNSLLSVEGADAYFGDRPGTKWDTAVPAKKQAALIAATDYIDLRFTARFMGAVIAAEEVPFLLQSATAEYAVRALDGPLVPDPKVGDNGLGTVLTRKKIGPIEKEYAIVGNAGKPETFRSYPSADGMIARLLRPSGNRVIR